MNNYSSLLNNLLNQIFITLLRDFSEIESMQSSHYSSLLEFSLRSYRKILIDSIDFINKNFPLYSISFSLSLDTLHPNLFHNIKPIDKSTNKRVIINPIDGFNLFARGLPFFSTSFIFQDFIDNSYKTFYSITHYQINRKTYIAEDGVFSINGLRQKKSAIKNHEDLNLCIADNLDYDNIKNIQNIIKFENQNLALAFLACGKFDHILIRNIKDDANVLSGLFMCELNGIKLQIEKNNDKIISISY